MSAERTKDRLLAARVIPVLRFDSAELTLRAVEGLVQAGFDAVEITMTTPGAAAVIERLAGKVLVGAGTVLDEPAARNCLTAGAQFLVSPGLFPALVDLAHAAGCAALVGGYTPTEVLAAHRAGADIVKVFPASSGGPAHVAALHAIYPDILLCPTGGVALHTLENYFAAGAAVVGVGNAIVPLEALKKGELDAVRAHAEPYLKRRA